MQNFPMMSLSPIKSKWYFTFFSKLWTSRITSYNVCYTKLLRDSKLDDVPEILEIYNYAIKNSVATFHTDEQTIQERIDWFNQHDKTHPILSMLSENRIVAWGSLSQWNPKPAYNGTVELTLYVHKDFRGRNYGKIMMESLITRARELNLHTIIRNNFV